MLYSLYINTFYNFVSFKFCKVMILKSTFATKFGRVSTFLITVVLSILMNSTQLHSTSIIAPLHLGDLAINSNQVVLAKLYDREDISLNNRIYQSYKFQVSYSIKGGLQAGELFEVRNMSYTEKEIHHRAVGDIDLSIGPEYLLFLEKHDDRWIPKLMSFGIYKSVSEDGIDYLVPSEQSREMNVINPEGLNPNSVYDQSRLIRQLEKYVRKLTDWDERNVIANRLPSDISIEFRAAPSHCRFLSIGNNGFRWNVFGNNAIPFRYSEGGDYSFSGAIAATQAAISEMNNTYLGVDLQDAGTHDFLPDCVGGSASSGNFLEYLNANGGYLNTLIIYNDPCDEIPDLNNCTGIVAISGLYGISDHYYDNKLWYTGGYGYCIVNDNVGPCINSTLYRLILIHELSHSLGHDHIPSSYGTANLNATCCYNPNSLDINCYDYLYEPPLLALDGLELQSRQVKEGLIVSWNQVANISDRDRLELERSPDGKNWQKLTDLHENAIEYLDSKPLLGLNYYRLKELSKNSGHSYSQTTQSSWSAKGQNFKILNDENGQMRIMTSICSLPLRITLRALDGRTIFQRDYIPCSSSEHFLVVDQEKIPGGIYIIDLKQGNESFTDKLCLSRF